MRFLKGDELVANMQRLVSYSPAKIAIAYWGVDALRRLDKLDPNRTDLKIICCLSGGKSAPEIIEQFGDRARQNDRLHAKVIWTPSGAIVGSANASSNGLPDEEKGIGGLIEAGAFVDDAANLTVIESWFDDLYRHSQCIEESDLKAAREARRRQPKQTIPELIDIPLIKLNEDGLFRASVRRGARSDKVRLLAVRDCTQQVHDAVLLPYCFHASNSLERRGSDGSDFCAFSRR